MTSRTPSRPRAFNDRRKLVQKLSFSLSPSHSPALPGARRRYPHGDDQRLRDDAVADTGCAAGGGEEYVGKVLRCEGAVTELGDFLVHPRADPRHLGCRCAGVCAERFHQVVDFASGDAVHVGLHYHREQGLVHAAAPLQQCGKE